jgi:hypothetical protein
VKATVSILSIMIVSVFFFAVFAYLGWIQIRLPSIVLRFWRWFSSLGQEDEAYELSNENRAQTRGVVDGAKLKIALSFLQVSAVYVFVYDVSWPASFVNLLSYFSTMFNLNLLQLPVVRPSSALF